MAKKPTQLSSKLSYEEVVKAIRELKSSSRSLIGEEIDELCRIERYTTNIPTLDFLGGVTKGRVNLFVGPKSSAKSTACYMLLAKHTKEIEASGQIRFVIVWATEGFDAGYAKSFGVNTDFVILRQEKIIEEGLAICEDIIRMGAVEAMIWDSMDMTIARKTQDNDYSATRGSSAGAFSDHLPRFYNTLLEFGVTSYWIKQARVKQGAYSPTGAEVLTMSGGKIVEHIPDNIYFFKRGSNYNLSYTPIQIKCEKARSSKIGTVLEIPLGELGFDKVRDIVSVATLVKHITVRGAGWSSYIINGEEYKDQGQEKIIDRLRNNPDLLNQFWKDVYDKYILNNPSIIFNSTITMETELLLEDDKSES